MTSLLQKEPALAVTAGLAAASSAGVTIYQATQGQVTWSAAIPAIALIATGWLVRFAVISPDTAAQLQQDAADAAAALEHAKLSPAIGPVLTGGGFTLSNVITGPPSKPAAPAILAPPVEPAPITIDEAVAPDAPVAEPPVEPTPDPQA